MPHPFHLAYHVTDLGDAREFYSNAMGATEGRSTDTWVDFDFFGHQLSLHEMSGSTSRFDLRGNLRGLIGRTVYSHGFVSPSYGEIFSS